MKIAYADYKLFIAYLPLPEMLSKTRLVWLFYFSLVPFFSFSQSDKEKPKVALVLSGGGAKGIAHIPTLQALDSLHIVPDLIVGTSMGSVVGGLYAMGYSGDSIANIAKHADWNQLLGGKISLQNVSVEEKSEFNTYLVELAYENGSISPIPFIVNDQSLREFLIKLTYPTYTIESFDELPIPFRAVAADIINGKEIIIDKGSFPEALRASMSLPAVFSPVEYNEMLLVDGGVLNNFPVDIAIDLGADIVIGSDVGDELPDKKNLQSISDVLFQASMLNSHQKRPKNREDTDILINHQKTLTHGTGDFNQSANIYKQGVAATENVMDELIKLADYLQQFEQREVYLLESSDSFILDTVIYKGLSNTNLALLKARTGFKMNERYTLDHMKEAIHRALGTTIFNTIKFKPNIHSDSLLLVLEVAEKPVHQLKGATHYDRYKGIGLVANYTGRNIFGEASRSLISVDIAEQPKLKLQHQKTFGELRNWWWRSEVLAQQVEQKVYLNGENVTNTNNRYFEYDNQFNKNLVSFKNTIGFGAKYSLSNIKPALNSTNNPVAYVIEEYNYHQTKLYIHYRYNTLNKVYYATTGTNIRTNFNHIVSNNVSAEFRQRPESSIDESFPTFSKADFKIERRSAIGNSLTTILKAKGGFLFGNRNYNDDLLLSNYGVGAKYLLGGSIDDLRENNVTFAGLKETELAVTQLLNAGVAAQINLANRIYITPHTDLANVGFSSFSDYIPNFLLANGEWKEAEETSFLFSAGTTFSYNSILGPIDFDISWVNDINKFRFFLSAGYPLRSSE